MAAAAAAAAASSVSVVVYGTTRVAPSVRRSFHVASALPPLQRRSSLTLSTSAVPDDSKRFSSVKFKTFSSSEDSDSVEADDGFSNLKEKWDSLENKSTLLLYGGGAIVAVWLSSVVVGAINSVPLLPKIMELVGLGYTGWFVYRYLLFKSSRKELAEEIQLLKKKITGTD